AIVRTRVILASGEESDGRVLRRLHVFAARPLRPLALLERHRLPFAQLVERRLTTRLVEEVLAVARRNEAEPLVVHKPLDRAGSRRHVDLLVCRESATAD